MRHNCGECSYFWLLRLQSLALFMLDLGFCCGWKSLLKHNFKVHQPNMQLSVRVVICPVERHMQSLANCRVFYFTKIFQALVDHRNTHPRLAGVVATGLHQGLQNQILAGPQADQCFEGEEGGKWLACFWAVRFQIPG